MDKKSEYVNWYRILERIYGSDVPHLTKPEITSFVSKTNWLIVPISGETKKSEAILAQRPNLWFGLEDDKIRLGISYDKLGAVERFRNILSPFNEHERNEVIGNLSILDDDFLTRVQRKIKPHHFSESPEYTNDFVERSNRMDHGKFIKAFAAIDVILNERDLLETEKKYQLAPCIDLLFKEISKDENAFKDSLKKIKPAYETAIAIRTREEYESCKGCLCYKCPDKGEYEDCSPCPCPGFPKSNRKTTECSLSES